MTAMKSFECPVCLNYMVEEIRQCNSGHNVCQKCVDKLKPKKCPICKEDFSRVRNYALEHIATLTKLPCKHEGCHAHLEVKYMKHHVVECPHRPEPCILSFDGCTWKGTRIEIHQHIQDCHHQYLNKCHQCKNVNLTVYILFEFEQLFVIFCKADSYNRECYAGVYIPLTSNTPPSAEEFQITVVRSNATRLYKVEFSALCIQRCPINKIFNADQVIIYNRMINEFGLKRRYLKIEKLYKPEPCVLSFEGCTWEGTRKEISKHIEEVHNEYCSVLFLPSRIKNVDIRLLFKFDHLFLIFRRNDVSQSFAGMYVPLDLDQISPSAEEFQIVVTLQSTHEDQHQKLSRSCIRRCDISEIFNSKANFVNGLDPCTVNITKAS